MANDTMTGIVRDHYAAVARGEAKPAAVAVDDVAKHIGYSAEELEIAGDANLGLGCGNPLALTEVKPGMTVLDLGSGAGFDAFLALSRVGETGRVIGVDMTDDMLTLARENAKKRGATNLEFRKGFIEKLPVEDASVDYVISNCVINLSSDKPAVFSEIYRVLKPGGRFAVSDLVLLKPLPEELAKDVSAFVGCIAGASLMTEYVSLALEAGLRGLMIPQILYGKDLVSVLTPLDTSGSTSSCCGPVKTTSCCGSSIKSGSDVARQAADAVVSIKLHGKK
jgi:arsenite methyltransferase